MDDLIKEFLVESIENLDRLDSELVKLETDPSSQELLSSIFRTIHTIKGSCGFLGFSKLEKVAHVGESLLSRLRDGKLSLTPEFTSGLLAMVDAIRTMLGEIQTTEQDGTETYPELIETLNKLQNQGQGPAAKAAADQPLPKEPSKKQPGDSPKEISAKSIPPASMNAQKEQTPPVRPEPPAASAAAAGETSPAQHPTEESRSKNAAAETIRVDVHLLDRLMNLVGELVLTRNQIAQFSARQSDPNLVSPAQQLNLLTSELQEEVMRTRMQPISNVFDKFPRVVRDVATARGKQVLIEMEGKETELDRSLLEAIKDPLTHIVRNSVDHGIEMPDQRVARGKRPEGRLRLRACHEGGQVLVEISDDGAGIDTARVKSKAIERGIVTAQQAARMSEGELLNLVFLPGFSTAEKVTNLSGRGVGMDVVKTNIDRVNGTVDLQSYLGKGTTIKIKIPLTLAIVRAVIVQSNGRRFAIPQVNIQELVRLDADRVRTEIESVHGVPVYRMRGRLLPLVYLERELKTNAKKAAEVAKGHGGKARVVTGDKVDFEVARAQHLLWKSRLREFLDGKAALTVEEAGSHKSCALGKWLYGGALREYEDIPEMREMEGAHTQMHELVREIIGQKGTAQKAALEEANQRLGQFSDRVVSLLTTVESKLKEQQAINIVVLQANDHLFGLVVDEINDSEEIVVKPLSKQLRSLKVFAGATIMGDGKVALILDVVGLAQNASILSEASDRALAEQTAEEDASQDQSQADRQTFLLFAGPDDARMALPLNTVARLEEFPASDVEKSGGEWVIQYRGKILPLIRLEVVLEERRTRLRHPKQSVAPDPLQVLVCNDEGRTLGIVVERILDIVEDRAEVKSPAVREGILCAVVINDRVTELLDIPAIQRIAEANRTLSTEHAEVID